MLLGAQLSRLPRLAFPSCPPAVVAFVRTDCHALLHLIALLLPELQALDELVVHLTTALIADVVLGAHPASMFMQSSLILGI